MIATEVHERVLVVNEVPTPLREAGPRQAREAVVCIHGNPGSGADWRGLLGAVGGFTRAVAWDAPGFGQAGKPADFPQTVTGHAGYIDAALAELGIDRVHLVLHDFGGLWGLTWAAANPDRLASAVIVNANTGVFRDYRWHLLARLWRVRGLGELFMATTNRPGFRSLMRIGNPSGLPRSFVDRMYDDFDRGTRRAVLRLYRTVPDPTALGRQLASTLHSLDRPALVVWGRHDPYLPIRLAEQQRAAFPSAEVAVLDHSGHWPFADQPDQFHSVVTDFLRRVTAGRPGWAEANRG